MVNAEADMTLFDLIGMEWLAPEVQQIVAQLGRSKAVELSAADIYEFQDAGVKIITHKTTSLNDVAEIYIRQPSVTHSLNISLLPYRLVLGQSQAKIKSLLGEAYDSQLAYRFRSSSSPDIHISPGKSDGWDIYLSSQLPPRFSSRQDEQFLLKIHYPFGLQNQREIKDKQGNILMLFASVQIAGEIILKKWDGVLPERSGVNTPEKLAQYAQGGDKLRALFQQAWELYQEGANE